jgi:peptidoglycan/LPS O-acetylase OafA/YrhL
MDRNTDFSLTSGQKRHFEVLDGLRGIAAIAIVVFHFCEIIWTDGSENPIGHGFLAVDFFFCLSGFVIAYAYDDRMQKMSLKSFFTGRLIRLHPLVVLGSVLGLLAYLFDPFSLDPYAKGGGIILITFLCSIFLIPMPALPERYGNLFPLNAPAWSLFMEYIANIVYAFVLCRLHRVITLVLAVIAAVWLAMTAHRAGGLLGGWSEVNYLDGVARLSFSFLAGLTVYRFGWILKSKIGFGILSVLLLGALMFPYFTWNWAVESLLVMLVFPAIVALGAGATVNGWVKKCCVFFGRISYPLYMTHYAALWFFGNYYAKYQPAGGELFAIVSIGVIVLVAFGYLVMRYFDEPVRAYLNKKRIERMKVPSPITSYNV